MKRLALIAALALFASTAPAAAQEAEPATPGSVVAAAAREEWVAIAPQDLLVMELAPDTAGRGRQVVIQLMPPPFSQPWVENIRTLARAHWWDGTSVYRVVDNWVAQWGGGEGEGFAARALPEGMVSPVATYEASLDEMPQQASTRHNMEAMIRRAAEQAVKGIGVITDPVDPNELRDNWMADSYADFVSFQQGWPVAHAFDPGDLAWPIHCYAHVGVARDLAPDTGTGGELYAVIGHAPRQLDRNIAVVGRVIEGIEHLSILPRGTGEAGVYENRGEDTPVHSVRLASDLPNAPAFEYLSTDSDSFALYLAVRANRQDTFYTVPAGGVDICNVQVPIRRAER